jgi:hypothetical protein
MWIKTIGKKHAAVTILVDGTHRDEGRVNDLLGFDTNPIWLVCYNMNRAQSYDVILNTSRRLL